MIKLEKLKQAAADWVSQFEEPPEIQLKWMVSPSVLYLNDIWICPFKFVNDVSITETTIDLHLIDGILSIIILKEFDKHEIMVIERRPKTPDTTPKHIEKVTKTIEELQKEKADLQAELEVLKAREEPLEWKFDDIFYRCPKCGNAAQEDEYTGKDRLTPYCQYCGQRLVIPADADLNKVYDGNDEPYFEALERHLHPERYAAEKEK